MLLGISVVGLLTVVIGLVGAAAAYEEFVSQLPEFDEVERLGQDTGTTFETTKIYAWGDDPDGNGVELYRDRPREEWPKNEDGSVHMYTRTLDLSELLEEVSGQ